MRQSNYEIMRIVFPRLPDGPARRNASACGSETNPYDDRTPVVPCPGRRRTPRHAAARGVRRLANFGDNALAFELLYWVDVLKHNANKVASDLRHMIAGAFAENGVVMAFPQRDIHVDTARPLQIRLLPQQDVPPPAE